MREMRTLPMVLAILVGVALISSITMGGMMGGAMGPGMMYGYTGQLGGWGAGLTMGLGLSMMLAFWGAIIVGVVLLVRGIAERTSDASTTEDPLTILQRRYATGDIDRDTYDRMRRDLQPDSFTGTAPFARELKDPA